MGNHDSLHRHTIIYLSLQEIAFEEVVGGPQSSLSFDLLMEIRTGNCCDLSLLFRDISAHVWYVGLITKHVHHFYKQS